jgi:hypothetical protein
MRFLIFCFLTFVAAWLAMMTVRMLTLPYWAYFVVCLFYGAVLYIVNSVLINWYIERRAPNLASHDDVGFGLEAWELTAGTGVVPRWVSWLGLLSLGFFLAIPFEFVASLIRD